MLGGSGMVGSATVAMLHQAGFKVSWTSTGGKGGRGKAGLPGNQMRFRAGQPRNARRDLARILNTVAPDLVINALKGGEEYESVVTNSYVSLMLERLTAARVIYISSNAVFPRARKAWGYDDVPNPETFYGVTKLLGERKSQFVIRTSIVGARLGEDNQKVFGSYRKKYNCLWNGVTNYALARFITDVAKKRLQSGVWRGGVVHLCSRPMEWSAVVDSLREAVNLPWIPAEHGGRDKSLLLRGDVLPHTLAVQIKELTRPPIWASTR